MSLGRKDIVKNISANTRLSNKSASSLLKFFIDYIVEKSTNDLVKIHNFGTFSKHTSPLRIGRNPKSGIQYQISARKKLKFKPSVQIKSSIN
jgi:nucleoid DNA-binding protein